MSVAASLEILVNARTAQAQAALQQVQAQTKRTAELANTASMQHAAAWDRAGKRMSSIGKSMTRNVSVPAAAAGAVSVKMAIDFEESMSRIQNLAGASRSRMQQFREEIMKLAPAVGKSPQELADALYFIRSSGIKAADAMSVLTVTAKASAIGLGDTQTVADAVTSAMNAYRRSNLSAADATNILAQAVQKGKGEPEELAAAIGRVIPVASKLKVPFNDVGASLAGLTLQGLDAAEATTALRGVFLALLKPTDDGREALGKVGLSVEELRNTLETKGTLAMLQLLATRFRGNEEAMAKVFPNVRALVGAFNLTGDSAKRNAQIFNEMSGSVDTVGKGFRNWEQTDAAKMKQALASLQVSAVNLGTKLLPVLNRVVQGFAKLFGWLTKIPGAAEILIGAIVLGPLIRLIGVLFQIRAAWLGIRAAALAAGAAETAAGAASVTGAGGAMMGAAGLGAGAGAAGGGLAATLMKFAKGAGVLAAGVAVGDALVGGISKRVAEKSDNIWTALRAKAKPDDVFGVSGSDVGLGFLDKSLLQMVGLQEDNRKKAGELKAALEQVAKTHMVSPEQLANIHRLAHDIGLSKEQLAGVRQVVQPAAAGWRAFDQALRGTFISGGKMSDVLKAIKTVTGTLPPAARAMATDFAQQFGRMKNIAGAHIKGLSASVGFEIKKMKASIASGKDPINAVVNAYGGMRKAISRVMGSSYLSVKAGTRLINQLLIAQMRMLGLQGKPELSVLPSLGSGPGQVQLFSPQKPPGGQKGMIVPGAGFGDRVPLHIGGQLAAFVEPREQVSVLNATATQRMMQINSAIPRRQGGGKIPGFRGTSPGVVDDVAAGALNIEAAAAIAFLKKYASGSGDVRALLREAQRMSARHEPYLWGGGHGGFSRNGPWDCSGAVSQVLHGGGAPISAPMVSGAFESYGRAGSGPATIFANSEHVFMSIDGKGYGTSAENPGQGFGGPLSYNSRPGFVRRHPQLAKSMAAVGPNTKKGQPLAKGVQMGGVVPGFAAGGIIGDFAKAGVATHATKKSMYALMEAGYAESGMRDLPGGDNTSEGVLQLLASTARSTGINAHDEFGVAKGFLTRGYWGHGGAIRLSHQGLGAAMIAHLVQGNATGSGVYAAQASAAQDALKRSGLTFPNDVAHMGPLQTKQPKGKKGKTKGEPAVDAWVPSLPPAIVNQINSLSGEAGLIAQAAEFGQRASAFSTEQTKFTIGGKDELGWIYEQLRLMEQLREAYIAAVQYLIRQMVEWQQEVDKRKKWVERIKYATQEAKALLAGVGWKRFTADTIELFGLGGVWRSGISGPRDLFWPGRKLSGKLDIGDKQTRTALENFRKWLGGKKTWAQAGVDKFTSRKQKTLDFMNADSDPMGPLPALDAFQGFVSDPALRFATGLNLADKKYWGVFGGDILSAQEALMEAVSSGVIDSVQEAATDPYADIYKQMAIDLQAKELVGQLSGPILSSIPSIVGAYAKGGVTQRKGLALVGERGPEVAQFPVGTKIWPTEPAQSRGIGAQVRVEVHGDVHTDGRSLKDAIQVFIDERQAEKISIGRRKLGG